jgi:hypothetical protein
MPWGCTKGPVLQWDRLEGIATAHDAHPFDADIRSYWAGSDRRVTSLTIATPPVADAWRPAHHHYYHERQP